ncbi:MAG: response regulator transcription factor [Deltaproteobacteria bacterium]|nr:response regulator transcription factor [Deltaproteobacteria bacterium]
MTNTLIVEDNASFREILKNILISSFPFMTIREAADALEALVEIEAQTPELIFMDIRLPGENGIQLTRKIQSSHPATIIVVISNCDTIEYQKAALEAGAKAFVSKTSSTPTDIIETVSRIFPTFQPAV